MEDTIDRQLQEGKTIALSELDAAGSVLNYKRRQVVVYIPWHGENATLVLEDGNQGHRFHVTPCKAINRMMDITRDIFIATTDFSGEFYITGEDWSSGLPTAGRTRLKACKFCLGNLGLGPTPLIDLLSSRRWRPPNRTQQLHRRGLSLALIKLVLMSEF